MNLEKELFKLQDMKYQKFHSSLCPGAKDIIGVRVPEQRRLVREILKEDWQSFLKNPPCTYAEERNIYGVVIVSAPMEIKEKLRYMKKFIPCIDNWATCDFVCNSFKDTHKEQEAVWEFLMPYLKSTKTYELRFAIVMLLNYFINKKYIDEVLKILESIHSKEYYVNIAIAWAISVSFVKFPKETMRFMKTTEIDKWTYNKAIQKCTESLRIKDKDKEKLRKIRK